MMKKKPLDELGELQKSIMEIVWENSEASARHVQKMLEQKNKRRYAYTSILSMMQKLEEYGWLKHRLDGRTNIYKSTHSRAQEAMRSLKQYIKKIFHGNTQLLFQHLLEDEEISDEDLKMLQDLIKEKRKVK